MNHYDAVVQVAPDSEIAVLQQKLDDFGTAPAADRMMQPSVLRAVRRFVIHVGAVLQIEPRALQIFKVELAGEAVRDIFGWRFSIKDQLETAIVLVLGRVIKRFHADFVGRSAGVEHKLRQRGIVRKAGRSVERGFVRAVE